MRRFYITIASVAGVVLLILGVVGLTHQVIELNRLSQTTIVPDPPANTPWSANDDSAQTYWYYKTSTAGFVVVGTDCWKDERMHNGKLEKRDSSAPRLFICRTNAAMKDGSRRAEEIKLPHPGLAKGAKYLAVYDPRFNQEGGTLMLPIQGHWSCH